MLGILSGNVDLVILHDLHNGEFHVSKHKVIKCINSTFTQNSQFMFEVPLAVVLFPLFLNCVFHLRMKCWRRGMSMPSCCTPGGAALEPFLRYTHTRHLMQLTVVQ